ncbi:MAG TPA: hypothetical protein VM695_06230 [Phycisphaerae bacterium]|nr:hypothetical protein [Phycisphaerae bacterium]
MSNEPDVHPARAGAVDEAGDPAPAGPPRTLEEFKALPADQRDRLARSMTRRQRDELLGRPAQPPGRNGYL